MYTNDETWKKLQAFLPERNRISASCAPLETFSAFDGANIHNDVYNERNGNGVTLVLFHGVGGNGRLLSFIAVPLARRGYKVVCPFFLIAYGVQKNCARLKTQAIFRLNSRVSHSLKKPLFHL